ncbi:MAG: hypothetical protein P4L57_02400 [Rhizomicrobium sp.]|nr:hypothetical protein [Rhizomicrobium sp.]
MAKRKSVTLKRNARDKVVAVHGYIEKVVLGLVAARNKLTLWLLIIGFAMCAFATTLHIDTISFHGDLINHLNAFRGAPPNSVTAKQVGYFWALNWSLFSTCIAPAIVWFGIGALQALNSTLANLCERGMLRTKTFNKIEYGTLQGKWQRHMEQNRAMFLFIFFMVFYVVMSDWWSVVSHPLLYPASVTQTASDPVMEFDWSVASLFLDGHVNSVLLFIFGFVAYVVFAACVPALAISVTLCTLFYMLFLTTTRTEDGTQLHFAAIPIASGKDRHFGFKVFSDLFHNFLMMSLLILIGLWLMAVQNVYLRDMTHGDIYSMLTGEMSEAVSLSVSHGNVYSFVVWLMQPAKQLVYNPQVAWAALLFPIVSIISVLGCWFILGIKARQAQAFSRDHVAALAKEYGLLPDVLSERLDNEMEFWPVGWIKSNQLLVLMSLLFVSLVSYRAIVVPILLSTTLGIFALLKYFFFGGVQRRK